MRVIFSHIFHYFILNHLLISELEKNPRSHKMTTEHTLEECKEIFSAFQSAVHISEDSRSNHIFTVMGASGDLAKKKIYPTLWALYRDGLLPEKTYFLGYARSKIDIKELLSKTAYKFMNVKAGQEVKFSEWVDLNYYLAGSYDKPENFEELNLKILEISKKYSNLKDCNRIFYLALPPSVYTTVLALLSSHCKTKVNSGSIQK